MWEEPPGSARFGQLGHSDVRCAHKTAAVQGLKYLPRSGGKLSRVVGKTVMTWGQRGAWEPEWREWVISVMVVVTEMGVVTTLRRALMGGGDSVQRDHRDDRVVMGWQQWRDPGDAA